MFGIVDTAQALSVVCVTVLSLWVNCKLPYALKKEMADDSQQNTTFMLIDSIMRTIITAAIITPGVMVISVIIYKKELHRFHYWFVINLMISNIIAAITINPFLIALYLIKLFSPTKAVVHCGRVFSFLFIAPVCSDFMVINLTLDAFLAVAYPLQYKHLMTKTKAIIMIVVAWMLAASLTLPLIVSPDLDVAVDDLYLCAWNISAFLLLPIMKIPIGIKVISFNICLYWRIFKVKRKLNCLVEVSARESSSSAQYLKDQMKGCMLSTHFVITLLLIIVIDGFLRILRVIAITLANEHGFVSNDYFKVVFVLALWAENINHQVVYGLMLREVYHSVFCKVNNNWNIRHI